MIMKTSSKIKFEKNGAARSKISSAKLCLFIYIYGQTLKFTVARV